MDGQPRTGGPRAGSGHDARCYLHGALLESGRVDEARELADVIRREAPADTDVYLVMGENYALAGDLTQAHRWLTMGAERLERTDRPISGIPASLAYSASAFGLDTEKYVATQ